MADGSGFYRDSRGFYRDASTHRFVSPDELADRTAAADELTAGAGGGRETPAKPAETAATPAPEPVPPEPAAQPEPEPEPEPAPDPGFSFFSAPARAEQRPAVPPPEGSRPGDAAPPAPGGPLVFGAGSGEADDGEADDGELGRGTGYSATAACKPGCPWCGGWTGETCAKTGRPIPPDPDPDEVDDHAEGLMAMMRHGIRYRRGIRDADMYQPSDAEMRKVKKALYRVEKRRSPEWLREYGDLIALGFALSNPVGQMFASEPARPSTVDEDED